MEKRWEPDTDESLQSCMKREQMIQRPSSASANICATRRNSAMGSETKLRSAERNIWRGRNVKVFETRCAAGFFTVVVLPDADRPGLSTKAEAARKRLAWRQRLPKLIT